MRKITEKKSYVIPKSTSIKKNIKRDNNLAKRFVFF